MDIEEFLDKQIEEGLSDQDLSGSDHKSELLKDIDTVRDMIDSHRFSDIQGVYDNIKNRYSTLHKKQVEEKKMVNDRLSDMNREFIDKLAKLKSDIMNRKKVILDLIAQVKQYSGSGDLEKATQLNKQVNAMISQIPPVFIQDKIELQLGAIYVQKEILERFQASVKERFLRTSQKIEGMLGLAEQYIQDKKTTHASRMLTTLNEEYGKLPNGYLLEKVQLYDRIIKLQIRLDGIIMAIDADIDKDISPQADDKQPVRAMATRAVQNDKTMAAGQQTQMTGRMVQQEQPLQTQDGNSMSLSLDSQAGGFYSYGNSNRTASRQDMQADAMTDLDEIPDRLAALGKKKTQALNLQKEDASKYSKKDKAAEGEPKLKKSWFGFMNRKKGQTEEAGVFSIEEPGIKNMDAGNGMDAQGTDQGEAFQTLEESMRIRQELLRRNNLAGTSRMDYQQTDGAQK